MNYEFLKQRVMQQLQAEAAKKPHLTIVSNDTAQRDTPMEKNTTQAHCTSIRRHGAFDDLEASSRIISLGANALKGIGSMMLPGAVAADEETAAQRSELSEIFSFFGEVLSDHSQTVCEAIDRIEMAANVPLS